jgi:hypothetical protein
MGSHKVVRSATNLPRGASLHLLLGSSAAEPDQYSVLGIKRGRKVWLTSRPTTLEKATMIFEVAELELTHIRCGLRAVLARCMEKEPEKPGVYKGSALQYANDHFAVGTWPWIVFLVRAREFTQMS